MSDSPIARMQMRIRKQREWLETHHPETFTEQKHTQEGTSERAYWHHGYMMALRDSLAMLERVAKEWKP